MNKILIVCNNLLPNIGGMEQYIDNLIVFFLKKKFQVEVYIDKPQSKKTMQKYLLLYPKIIFFYKGNTKLNFLKNKILFKLKKNHTKFFPRLFLMFLGTLILLENKILFNSFYNKNKDYNLIIDNTILNHKKLRYNKKAVVVIHAQSSLYASEKFIFKEFFSWFFKTKIIRILNSWKTYVTVILSSEEDISAFQKISKFKKWQNFFKCSNGININFINKKNYNPKSDIISILRFENSTKNLDFMNEVSKNMDKKIVTYGIGPDSLLLTNTIVKKPILNQIEKFKILNNASLFIMTSNTEAGCPFSIIEALSMGMPIILRDTFPNAKNLAINNFNGILFSKNDTPKFVASEINKLFNNKNLLGKMSYNSNKLFFEKYTIEIFESVWNDIIKKVI